LTPPNFFFWGVCKRQCLSWKGGRCEWGAWKNHKSYRVHYQLNVCQCLICVMPLMVPILRSTEHIRNFVRSSIWKYINFSNVL
jgi:hypothetical protein